MLFSQAILLKQTKQLNEFGDVNFCSLTPLLSCGICFTVDVQINPRDVTPKQLFIF
jgi:hypothetical protein